MVPRKKVFVLAMLRENLFILYVDDFLEGDSFMNGLLLLGLSALILVVAYLFYGRYLVKTWGIDPKATTPAVAKEDGTDFVPTNKWSVFAHQFSSIAGAGPVTGPVMAMMFGWLPAFLWVIVGCGIQWCLHQIEDVRLEFIQSLKAILIV